MDTPFPPPAAGTLHPDPVQEQLRLRRLVAAHRPPVAPFDGVLHPGSFHRPAAGSLAGDGPDGPVKLPFTFAF